MATATDSKKTGKAEGEQEPAPAVAAAPDQQQAVTAAADESQPGASYDLMTAGEVRDLAAARGISLPEDAAVPEDTEKSLLVAELRANDSGRVSVARMRTLT